MAPLEHDRHQQLALRQMQQRRRITGATLGPGAMLLGVGCVEAQEPIRS